MSIVTVDLPSIAAQPQRNDMPVNIVLLYLSVLSCDYVLPSPTFYAFLTWHENATWIAEIDGSSYEK